MYKVMEKEILNPTVTKMAAEAPAIAKKALAGQFVIPCMHKDGERIPLTIAGYNREEGTITTILQIIGKTTIPLSQLNVGDSILDFVGPLGKPSHVDGYKKVCIIGGGVGCATTYPTAEALYENDAEVTVTMGLHSRDLIILEEEFKQVGIHTYSVNDDGGTDIRGLVASVLEDLINKGESFDEVIAIGSLIMMRFVCRLTKKYRIKTVVSMNPIMVDGTGMCGSCRLSVGEETKFVCVDSSNFDGHLMDFDEAMPREATYRNFEAHARDTACNLMNGEVR